jgi:2-polyprenyl-6-methoxyphenol hydroxylase-like FAD-dependent oxidoreductase
MAKNLGEPKPLGKHAIVVGGSIGGLLTARVLSKHFDQVTIVERDSFSENYEPRKGVPQGKNVHVIFGGGVRVINRLFPGFFDELANSGSMVCDFARDLCWYHGGVWKSRPESGLTSYWQSRPFLESNLLRHLRRDPNVRILEKTAVNELIADHQNGRIIGVELRGSAEGPAERLDADLVVDASGRGSQTPRWLEALGYERPIEKRVEVNIGYASRQYERPNDSSRDWQIMALFGTPPKSTRAGYIFPIEGGRWLVSEVGFSRDYPPDDDAGFLEFARNMELPDFYDAIKDAKPLSSVSTFKFPANVWHRYDQLSRFPEGLLVLGDAISTFNPVYGQGMSVCALEIDELRQMLESSKSTDGLNADFAKQFFRKAAKIIETPWLLATQADFLYPQTQGIRPVYTNALNSYLARVLQLCSGNDQIAMTFYEVLHFLRKPTAFFHPQVLFLVLCRTLGTKGFYRPSKLRPQLTSSSESGVDAKSASHV